jgi:hypothetical protein
MIEVCFNKVHLLYEPGYVTLWVSNLTEVGSDSSICRFPTCLLIPEVCWKLSLVIFCWWRNSLRHWRWHTFFPTVEEVHELPLIWLTLNTENSAALIHTNFAPETTTAVQLDDSSASGRLCTWEPFINEVSAGLDSASIYRMEDCCWQKDQSIIAVPIITIYITYVHASKHEMRHLKYVNKVQ